MVDVFEPQVLVLTKSHSLKILQKSLVLFFPWALPPWDMVAGQLGKSREEGLHVIFTTVFEERKVLKDT